MKARKHPVAKSSTPCVVKHRLTRAEALLHEAWVMLNGCEVAMSPTDSTLKHAIETLDDVLGDVMMLNNHLTQVKLEKQRESNAKRKAALEAKLAKLAIKAEFAALDAAADKLRAAGELQK